MEGEPLEQAPGSGNRENSRQSEQPNNWHQPDIRQEAIFGENRSDNSVSVAPGWYPNFFAIGPARTATTWLHNVLAPHANLPVTKETRFIDLYYRRGWRWYRAQFGPLREHLRSGEIAPTYFHSTLVRARIKQYVPGAKIICTLRDPVERLYSLFRYLRFRGSFRWEFEDAVRKDAEMIESARYGHYLKAWIDDFGRANVLVTIFDDIELDPQGYIDRVSNFVGIPRFVLPPSVENVRVNSSEDMRAPSSYPLASIAHFLADLAFKLRLQPAFRVAKGTGLKRVFFGKGQALAPFDPQFAMDLRKRLTPEIEEVERIIGRDLSAWKL